jgi:hypothetical protein
MPIKDVARDASSSAAPARGSVAVHQRQWAGLVTLVLFGVALVGQVVFGLAAYNEERAEQGQAAVALGAYLTQGHFLEAPH